MATPEGTAGDEGGTGRPADPAASGGVPSHDVFVSYSVSDKPVADAIVARLEQVGIRCWVAPRDVIPGQVWGQAILSAIETSRLMVVVLSGAANDSRQVIREVERAVANDVVVVPFRIDAVEPTGAMAYFLASEHWLDAMSPPLETHIAQLVTVARALLVGAAQSEAATQATQAVQAVQPVQPPHVAPPAPPYAPPAPPAMQQTPPAMQAAPPAPLATQPARPAWQPTPASAPSGRSSGGGRIVAAVAAVAGIALVAVVGAWAAHLGPFATAAPAASTPVALATSTPSTSPTQSILPTLSIPPTPSETPGRTAPSPGASPVYGVAADVHALRQVLPLAIASGCSSLELLGHEIAALSCTATGTRFVWYERFGSLAELDADWASLLADKGIAPNSGGCTSQAGGEDGWNFQATPDTEEGRAVCFGVAEDKPMFVWTDRTMLVRTWIAGTPGATLASLRERWVSGDLDPSRDVAALVMGTATKTALVPADLIDSCTRIETTTPQRAAVSCQTADSTSVSYTSYASQADVDTDWAAVRTTLGLEKDGGGKCGQGVPGETTWDLKSDPAGTARGRVMCADSGGSAVLAWTDYGTSTRVRTDGATIDALYALWAGGTLDPVAK